MRITVLINGKLKTFNANVKNFVEAMKLVRDMKGDRKDVEVVSIEPNKHKKGIYRNYGQLPGEDN
ncbi:hypothetical protein KAR91_46415 [Candidatus Pacearchaeota archaeon]|nr:hypothetical protein [Candidatus Pacearchaeota archaeon]